MLIGLSDLEGTPQEKPLFCIGDVVCHGLYKYRGVIVAYDPMCFAGDKWYYSNKTQPAKEQPWYHVLVHESGGLSTYVAQSNLNVDSSGEPVIHARISAYFSGFLNGAYILKEQDSNGVCGI